MDSATSVALRRPVGAAPTMTRSERRRAARRPRGAVLPWLVAAVTLGLRLLTAANGPTDWDSAQYAAAVGRYDVTHGRPQPPGYWLYVVSGRFLHQVTGVGTIHCLVLVAALASAAAAGMTVVAGRDLGGWWVGLAAGAVVATSPFAWFNGSIVATYSFDLLAGPLLMVLAWRARPGSWHGVGAVIALGLLSGFRQSVVQSFAVLALVAVVASTRRWSDWLKVVLAGAAAVAAWLVPMALSQPGGLTAWARATRLESDGAAQATSVFDHGAASLNFGTFAGYTVTALAPVVVLTLLAAVALGLRALPSERGPGTQADGDPVDPGRGGGDPGGRRGGGSDTAHWIRPWYQWRITILTAAILPPVLLVTLVQFAKGGYLLAYLPGAVIALLLPLGALNRTSSPGRRASAPWVVATSVGVVLVVALGSQRFVAGAGVLPQRLLHTSGGLWLTDPRYQAPYADTRAAIRAADSVDAALAALGPSLQAGRDVVVLDDLDGGLNIYRNAGWALPDDRVALIAPGALIYNQLGGSLYYARGDTVAVGPSGSAFLIAAPTLPGLASLVVEGAALPVTTPRPIGGFRVYQVIPGSSVLGVRVVAQPGPRPLGRGI